MKALKAWRSTIVIFLFSSALLTACGSSTSVPEAPTGVVATQGPASTWTSQITLAWAPVADATYYNIYWSTAPGITVNSASLDKINLLVSSFSQNNPYILTGLASQTTYYYVVTAGNSAGESAASSEVHCTTGTPQ